MGTNLKSIEKRHGTDRWRDIFFIGAAVLLTALSIGAVTSKAAGRAKDPWTVQVIESNVEIQQTALR
ncbi:MAG TPA: hypothetical protein VLB44_00200 [Kofleriaceae bacterium]|nr:hypothetical protein [Kofleriaceae bacterium]